MSWEHAKDALTNISKPIGSTSGLLLGGAYYVLAFLRSATSRHGHGSEAALPPAFSPSVDLGLARVGLAPGLPPPPLAPPLPPPPLWAPTTPPRPPPAPPLVVGGESYYWSVVLVWLCLVLSRLGKTAIHIGWFCKYCSCRNYSNY